jgi:hypothetical protein
VSSDTQNIKVGVSFKDLLTKKQSSPLVINKIIYAKKKGMWDQSLAKKVFMNEIQNHLRKYPDLEFHKIGEAVSNQDYSKTFPIYFILKNIPQSSA